MRLTILMVTFQIRERVVEIKMAANMKENEIGKNATVISFQCFIISKLCYVYAIVL
jgi:hypothetical protein